ncbi:MAG: hypothetical protein HZA50_19050 [Planctomycetes bacterium]|nr:hypothetical protein [Planctomycetota bacterium]
MLNYECNVTTHGNQQFELDVAYPVEAGKIRLDYALDLYVFCPYQLGMNKDHYGVKKFLEDTHSYTRFTVPAIPLAKLVDPACEKSPLIRIRQALAKMTSASELDVEYIIYELRMFANIFHRQVKEARKLLKKLPQDGYPAEETISQTKTFIDDLQAAMKLYRTCVLHELVDPNIPDVIRQAANWADEQVSLSAEKQFFNICCFFGKDDRLSPAAELLRPHLSEEACYRRSKGFRTVVSPVSNDNNERFIYHEGVLKKWAESCLYLSASRNRFTDRLAQILMGVAAGVAMLFAVAATVLATKWFPPDSIPWAILIVIMYVFKDRIKEWLRGFFIAYIPALVADKTDDLVDPKVKKLIGSSKIRVRMQSSGDIPQEIRRIRNLSTNEFRNILPPEDVINFHKETSFNGETLMKHHLRLESITEILRFNLHNFLVGMDDPSSTLMYTDAGKIEKVEVKRIYHIHLLIHLCGKKLKNSMFFHYRLDLNRDGLIRTEHIRSLTSDGMSIRLAGNLLNS